MWRLKYVGGTNFSGKSKAFANGYMNAIKNLIINNS